MSGHALEVLEFERVLDRIARRAASEAGRRRIRGLRPRGEDDDVRRELARVAAVIRFVSEKPGWALDTVPEVDEELAQLRVEGSVLEPLGIHRLGTLLRSSRRLARELTDREGSYPELATIAERLVERRELEKVVERSVDDEGRVLSSASKELKRVRDRLRGAHAKVVRKLESYLQTLPERFVVSDASVTIRDGRYVIPLRREGRGEVGGIVHDESQTGSTLFVEPPVAIEIMNALRELEREEQREIRRVLGELTARFAPERAVWAGAYDALVDFDSLHARARAAIAWNATVPEIGAPDDRSLVIEGGRHPLLVEEGDGPVVPFDLTLSAGERCLVVSGPNTGGKSVFLKAVGLTTALAQSGVVPPVGPGTRLPVFTSFYADIGDEQSIARNLSTFSAHLENLKELVGAADDRSLVLIDEMGTGTDPQEGAALARAILEVLVARGATTLASSHLGELKRLDSDGSGIVNASLQFDAERMEPTYRLVKGRPGRSYGLAIARRLGLPDEVLDRAEAYRDADQAEMENVLARLEEQEQSAEQRVHELESAKARAERLEKDVEEREAALREAERTAEDRARQEARELLMSARQDVEEAIAELRAAASRGADLDEAARAARRRVERAAERQADAIRDEGRAGREAAEVEPGDHVKVRATGARGRVAALRDDRAVVEVGAMRMEIALTDLTPVDAPKREKARPRAGGGWSAGGSGAALTEVDLRGLRVDEMEIELSRSLDRAVLEDVPRLRIIHGKGTGALRQRVSEMLASDGRVTDFRMGEPNEGGAGVTVALFGGAA